MFQLEGLRDSHCPESCVILHENRSVNDIIVLVCLSAHMLVHGSHVFSKGHFQKEALCIFGFNARPLGSELFMSLLAGCEQIKHKL